MVYSDPINYQVKHSELKTLRRVPNKAAAFIYLWIFKPSVDRQTGMVRVNYRNIAEAISELTGSPQKPRGRDINHLIQQLVTQGLVINENDLSSDIDGQPITLVHDQPNSLVDSLKPCSADWQPEPTLFAQIAMRAGVSIQQHSITALNNFINYWLSRPDVNLSDYAWTLKYVNFLKTTNQQKVGDNSSAKVGYQAGVPPKASVNIDSATQALIEKYGEKD